MRTSIPGMEVSLFARTQLTKEQNYIVRIDGSQVLDIPCTRVLARLMKSLLEATA